MFALVDSPALTAEAVADAAVVMDPFVAATTTRSAPAFDVVYDRSSRLYHVVDATGEVVAMFPSKQRGEATRFALRLLNPELAAHAQRMADRSPLLERVAWAGAELAANGAVEINDSETVIRTGVLAMVDSSDGMGRYALTMQRIENHPQGLVNVHVVACNCAHYATEQAPVSPSGLGRVCKHVAGYWLSVNTNEAAS